MHIQMLDINIDFVLDRVSPVACNDTGILPPLPLNEPFMRGSPVFLCSLF